MRAQLEQLKNALGQAGKAGEGATEGAVKAGAAFGAAAGGAQIAVEKLRDLARAVADISWGTARFAVESASFRRNTLAGFELMEGSAEEAQRVFQQIKALADKTPFETKDVMRLFGSLRGSGFRIRETQDILAGAFDVGAVIGGSEGRDVSARMVEGIVKIRSEGRLTADVIKEMALASGGKLNLGAFYQQLATLKKISVEQAKQQTSKGTIASGEGITAILRTIQASVDKGGPLGKATEKFGVLSWEGQISTFKSRLASIFETVDIQPLVDTLTRLNELLSESSPAGKRIREFFNRAFGAGFALVARLLDGGTLTKIFDGISTVVEGMAGAFQNAWPYIVAFGDAFSQSLKPVLVAIGPILGKLFGSLKEGAGPSPTLIRIIQVMADGLAKIVIVLGAVLAVAELVSIALFGLQALLSGAVLAATSLGTRAIGWLLEAMRGLENGAWNAATAFIDGLVNGISEGWSRVTGAVKDLATGAIDTVRSVFQIGSPSRVMRSMGLNTATSVSLGVRSGAPDVERSFDSMLSPFTAAPTLPALPPPTPSASIGAAGGAPTSFSVEIASIQINGVNASNPDAVASSLEDALERRLIGLLERLALEQGAPAG